MRRTPRLLAVAATVAAGCVPRPEATPPDETAANRHVVEAFVAAVNARDFDALDTLVTEDVVRTSPSTPGVTVTDRDQLETFLRADIASSPDQRVTVRELVAERDMVAGRFNYAGTQTGPLGPFPASGEPFDTDFAGFLRIEGGRIAEMWVVWDNVAFLTQLGHMTPPGSARAEP